MRKGYKVLALVLAVVLVLGAVIGTTVAWLITNTTPVVNTFTYGDINITLEETDTGLDEDDDKKTNQYQMVPGKEIDKDPKVTVLKNSEDCWLFVKLEKSSNFDEFMTYAIADGWTELDATKYPGIYYREVAMSDNDAEFTVLKDNKVTVKTDVTKDMFNKLDADANNKIYPQLKVTAYAVQKAGVDTPAAAWELVIGQTSTTANQGNGDDPYAAGEPVNP
jgi:hypothetical protein